MENFDNIFNTHKASHGATVLDNTKDMKQRNTEIEQRYHKALDQYHARQEQLRKDEVTAQQQSWTNNQDDRRLNLDVWDKNLVHEYQDRMASLSEESIEETIK